MIDIRKMSDKEKLKIFEIIAVVKPQLIERIAKQVIEVKPLKAKK